MPEAAFAKYRSLLSAASFAARAHRDQLRKDRQTPYVAHPFRVCLIVRHVFGIDDPKVLTSRPAP
jgi:guanosine-3',5'-bis(diphosphate) 3'-pyrophosphohydrolase